MDPTVCFEQMKSAWEAGDFPAAIEHAHNLRNWIDRGGFPPVGSSMSEVEESLALVLAAEREHEP